MQSGDRSGMSHQLATQPYSLTGYGAGSAHSGSYPLVPAVDRWSTAGCDYDGLLRRAFDGHRGEQLGRSPYADTMTQLGGVIK